MSEELKCTWTEKEDEQGIYYDTSCGRTYCVEYTQSPIASMELCPYCGKKLVENKICPQ